MTIKELQDWEVVAVLAEVQYAKLPITLTRWDLKSWRHCLASLDRLPADVLRILLSESGQDFNMTVGDKIGITARVGHQVCSFSTTIIAIEPSAQGNTSSVIAKFPFTAKIIQRRINERVQIPKHNNVRTMFWPGGLLLIPSEDTPDVPAWVGKVADLSTSGCRMNATHSAAMLLRQGDLIGLILSFDDYSVLRGDAHIMMIKPETETDTSYHIRFAAFEQLGNQSAVSVLSQKLREYAA